jgi:cytoskeletal protein CcmA (bactofilin family)
MKTLFTQISVPTLIAEGSRIHGSLQFTAEAQIHGEVEGDVEQHSLESLRVGQLGTVKGSVRSVGPVLIEGRVEGDVSSSTKVQLSYSACVHGVLNAPAIEVAPGAIFEGEFQMKAARSTPRATVPKKAA